jgi:hypothetical protein
MRWKELHEVLRPQKGWRAFGGEVGVIVLGVLVALGIGEVAEAIRWHNRVQAARASFRAEFAVNATYFYERVNSQPCLERRLDELGELIRTAHETGRLPRVGPIGLPNLRPISTAAWDTTVGNGVTLRMRPEDATELATLVKMMTLYSEWSALEQEDWAALSALEGAPRTISGDLISDMARTLAVVRYRTGTQGLAAQQSLDSIKSRGIAPAFETFGTSTEKSAAFTANSPMCQPLLVSQR